MIQKSGMPLVSVVVPIFNGAKYLEMTLSCIKNQTYSNYEFLFVDDGSTDDTVTILQSYSEKNKRVKVITRDRDPKGAPTCRNIGLLNASGKYIIYIDADDIFTEAFLKKRVEFMENHEQCEYATFRGSTIIEKDDGFIYGNKIWGMPISKDSLSDFLSVRYPYSIWNNIYRLDSFKHQEWDEKLKIYQDFDFAVITIIDDYKHKFVQNEEFDYYYRIGQKSNLSANFISDGKLESTKYLFSKISKRISKLENSEKYKKAFTSFYVLQYTRLLLNGSRDKIEDYIDFCRNNLYKKTILKMRFTYMIYSLFSSKLRKRHFFIKLLITVFYYPQNSIDYIKSRIKPG